MKKYILITGCSNGKSDSYRSKIGYIGELETSSAHGDLLMVHFGDLNFEFITPSDAIEVSLVVIDGMLYAVNDDEIKKGNWVIHTGHIFKFVKEEWDGKGIEFLCKTIASSDPALISDGVLPIKNADEVMRGLEGEKKKEMGKILLQNILNVDKNWNDKKAAPMPTDTDKNKNVNIQEIANKWWYELSETVRQLYSEQYFNQYWREVSHIDIGRIYQIVTRVPDNTTKPDASMLVVKGDLTDRNKAMLWWHSLDEGDQNKLSAVFPTITGSGIEKTWSKLNIPAAALTLSEDEIPNPQFATYILNKKVPWLQIHSKERKEQKTFTVEDIKNVIRYLRTHDKMGKSVDDLFEEYVSFK